MGAVGAIRLTDGLIWAGACSVGYVWIRRLEVGWRLTWAEERSGLGFGDGMLTGLVAPAVPRLPSRAEGPCGASGRRPAKGCCCTHGERSCMRPWGPGTAWLIVAAAATVPERRQAAAAVPGSARPGSTQDRSSSGGPVALPGPLSPVRRRETSHPSRLVLVSLCTGGAAGPLAGDEVALLRVGFPCVGGPPWAVGGPAGGTH